MHTPIATYRLQLRAGVGFAEAAGLVDYLAGLGVSHLYLSPIFAATPGSAHGYDVVDPARIDPVLGGDEGYRQLCAALGDRGMGLVLDVVPNHMAIGSDNRWWWDVLEHGPASRYASYFDVDWNPPEERLRDVVLLPLLGDHYGRVLESGDLRLERDRSSFTFRYHDRTYPVARDTSPGGAE
jgi:(1->4)-alpha-D-glucan 1-alpha-D-glucosylmutase